MHLTIKAAVLLLAIAAPVATAIAASKSPKLARCDGKNRRPANVYGSILPTVDPAAGTMTPASATQGGVEIFPQGDPAMPNRARPRKGDREPSTTHVPPIGAITPATPYGSC